MAVKKNVVTEKKLNMFDLKEGIYFDEKAFGKLHLMKEGTSVYGDKEYVYEGRIHKGEVAFVLGSDLKRTIPVKGAWDYGYTLEGMAKDLFVADEALTKENEAEKRKFVYIKTNSKLRFVGDYRRNYRLHVRVFDIVDEKPNYRWLVLFLEEVR